MVSGPTCDRHDAREERLADDLTADMKPDHRPAARHRRPVQADDRRAAGEGGELGGRDAKGEHGEDGGVTHG